ncbi:hypothetical protein ACKKBF_B20680 [Auxenochlorella protothecoides x Auxenochlorella symbiontica]
MSGLVGRVAFITGGAKGIGLACAQALGRGGARVVIADVSAEDLKSAERDLGAEGIECASAVCDVGDRTQVEAAVDFTVKTFGKLDVAVANAGIVRAADFLDLTDADWDAVIRVNLTGVFLVRPPHGDLFCLPFPGHVSAGAHGVRSRLKLRAAALMLPAPSSADLFSPLLQPQTGQVAARQMKAQGHGGSIVNISSVNGVMAIPTIANYNASKGGVNNLTRAMALSLAPHAIRVNAVGPGSIMTDVLRQVVADKAAMAKVLSRTPMLRAGEPIEIGNVVKFFASDDSSYITGQILYADGGRMALNYTVPVPEEALEGL